MIKTVEIDPNYDGLHRVLMDALAQASTGKGKERHALGEPYEDQLVCLLARQLGVAGPAYQVCKKAIEACRLPYPANVNEVLGAINYAAGMVLQMEAAALAEKRQEVIAKGHHHDLMTLQMERGSDVLRAGEEFKGLGGGLGQAIKAYKEAAQ